MHEDVPEWQARTFLEGHLVVNISWVCRGQSPTWIISFSPPRGFVISPILNMGELRLREMK